VVAVALAVTMSGGVPGAVGPTGIPGTPLPGQSGVVPASPSSRPTPTATLPGIATPTPAPTASTAPEGIVATRIRMPRVGIDLRIVEGDGTDAPLNRAAHYPGTGWPGAGTNIYLYGHARAGMFLELWGAEVGDEIFLDLKDGSSKRYLVTRVLPKVAWNAMEYLGATPTEQLTLQTCTGNTATAPRFIVIAEPAP
jgi:LPXTG-site transpeptidase (sortase) family protein